MILFPFSKIIAPQLFFDVNYKEYYLSICVFNTETKDVEFFDNNFLILKNENLTNKIIEYIKNINLKFDSSDLILIEEGQFLEEFIHIFKDKSNLVKVSLPKTRILSINNDKIDYPSNGLFFKIFENKDEFLLITTGFPDLPERGLPNPLKIYIYSKFIDINKILQSVYYLSFMQTESFEKLHLPFLIDYNNRHLHSIRNEIDDIESD